MGVDGSNRHEVKSTKEKEKEKEKERERTRPLHSVNNGGFLSFLASNYFVLTNENVVKEYHLALDFPFLNIL